jgi:DNA-binding NarL/FixJ family response regulator
VADDHHIVRLGIAQEIAGHDDIALVGEAVNGLEAWELTQALTPDVLLLDINMPELSGIQVIKRLNRPEVVASNNGPQILVFSSYNDRQYIWSCLAAGARGYLLKNEPPEQVVAGVRQLAQGQVVLSVAVQTTIVETIRLLTHNLSPTEMDVLRFLSQGMNDFQIARQLKITEDTVKYRLNSALRKIPFLRTRADAVTWSWINHIASE